MKEEIWELLKDEKYTKRKINELAAFFHMVSTDEYITFIKLMNSMEDLSINEDELERKKKVYLSSLIYMTDNIFRLNHKVMNDINKYGEIIDNNYDEIKSLNIIEMRKVLNSVDFSNYNVIVVEKDN